MRFGISLLFGRPLHGLFLSLDRTVPQRHIKVSCLLRDDRPQHQVWIYVHKRCMCRQNGERESGLSCSPSMHGDDAKEVTSYGGRLDVTHDHDDRLGFEHPARRPPRVPDAQRDVYEQRVFAVVHHEHRSVGVVMQQPACICSAQAPEFMNRRTTQLPGPCARATRKRWMRASWLWRIRLAEAFRENTMRMPSSVPVPLHAFPALAASDQSVYCIWIRCGVRYGQAWWNMDVLS